jgi:putative DNA methylase
MSTAAKKTASATVSRRATPRGDTCFIETQFPVSKMSKESFAERTAKQSQTLTGLGKWWGRKPLVLCRATILGLLLPATDDPQLDREVFLRLMTMDTDGLSRRRVRMAPKDLFDELNDADRARWFTPASTTRKASFKPELSKADQAELEQKVFRSLPYDRKIKYCARPEQIDGPSEDSWRVINAHLGTHAATLGELVRELGERRFGHTPRVGDTFCGGGSIPFEAARIGCDAYASDLNPVAAMMTWAAFHIIGGGEEVVAQAKAAQAAVYEAVDRQVTEWGIEHREPDPATGRRWRADAYLYCAEATCPECKWRAPLAPSWVIGKGTRTTARLVPDTSRKAFNFEIETDASPEDVTAAEAAGTAKDSSLVCPHCKTTTPIRMIRGDGRGTFGDNKSLLRPWTNEDLVPRDGDIFGERLYCIRWVDEWVETQVGARGKTTEKKFSERYYAAPTAADLRREELVLTLLRERFQSWQQSGALPSRRIDPGYNTDQPIRERGWSFWHHLYTPRQLLMNGLFNTTAGIISDDLAVQVYLQLLIGRLADWNSRLCRWVNDGANEKTAQTFSNMALNTLSNFGVRTFSSLDTTWKAAIQPTKLAGASTDARVADARSLTVTSDFWITDPPYADAIRYEEISELFLGWHAQRLAELFPEWPVDTRRVLAVKGQDEDFRQSMVECYRQLAKHMPANGLQVVMFTHQDAGVWADLALILWAAGLRVTAAWCVVTETDSELKQGNYVQGTVLLVLRKHTETDVAFLDEVYQEVEAEVRRQLDSMKSIDDSSDPSFSDTDYQLAAYAAALRVLTGRNIEEIDVAYELTRQRNTNEVSKVEEIIRKAVSIACDHMVPVGLDTHAWKSLVPLERLYLKGLEMETHGERRQGVYQELARGFRVDEYKPLLFSSKANESRLKTATEFARKEMGDAGFGATVLRHVLFAVLKTAESESTKDGITWLTTEVPGYAQHRQRVIEMLEYLATLKNVGHMLHWHKDADAAALLAGALRNRADTV